LTRYDKLDHVGSGDRGMSLLARTEARISRYSATAKCMHWLIALVVILMIPEGLIMKRLIDEGPTRERLYDLHEAVGALVLIVMIVRLGRRFLFGAPSPDETLPPFERRASLAAQYAFYVLLIVMPVLGWIGTNAYGDPVSVFGLFTFPALVGKDEAFSDQVFVWHLAVGLIIAGLILAHAGAALYHRYVKRDGVLARMLPGG
jgi:cytochrome b561